MYKTIFVVLAVAICSTLAAPKAKPGILAAAYTAPIVAPAVVTAQSYQIDSRAYHGLVRPVVSAPIVKAAPLVASPVAYSPYYNPYVASPYVAAPYVAHAHGPVFV